MSTTHVDQPFDFNETGSILISTLHSAKELDFPVVFLFLYRPPYFDSAYDAETSERMTRSLVYVSATRAMDQLDVFALNVPSSPAIADLVKAFWVGEHVV